MTTLALELNDAGVVAARALADGRAQIVVRSPGYAVADARSVVTGREARAAARLKPRFRYTRFWEELDTSPLPRPLPPELSRADLAHAHLEEVWKRAGGGVDRVLLLVPGWYGDEALGLLAGIARACELPVSHLIDASLAGALAEEAPESVYVDLHLHRASAARIERGTHVCRRTLRVETEVGAVALEDAWVGLLARTFVHQTRFDPLHRAENEQRLYDELPLLLDELRARDAAAVAMEASGKEHRVELGRDELVAAVEPHYRRILALVRSVSGGASRPVLLSSRAARLPGLVAMLERDGGEAVGEVSVEAPAANVFASLEHLPPSSDEEDELAFVTSLPVIAPVRARVATPPRAPLPERRPTHVLFEGVAHPIGPAPFVLSDSLSAGEEGLELGGAAAGARASLRAGNGRVVVENGGHVNGSPVPGGTALSAGDRLRVGTPGVEILLIEVRD